MTETKHGENKIKLHKTTKTIVCCCLFFFIKTKQKHKKNIKQKQLTKQLKHITQTNKKLKTKK